MQAEEQLAAGRVVAPDTDMAEQEALLKPHRSARKIRLARWRYRQRVAEMAAVGMESDDAGKAFFGETDAKLGGLNIFGQLVGWCQCGGGQLHFVGLRRRRLRSGVGE